MVYWNLRIRGRVVAPPPPPFWEWPGLSLTLHCTLMLFSSAPPANRHSQTSIAPAEAAKCSGVNPLSFRTFTLHWQRIMYFTASAKNKRGNSILHGSARVTHRKTRNACSYLSSVGILCPQNGESPTCIAINSTLLFLSSSNVIFSMQST